MRLLAAFGITLVGATLVVGALAPPALARAQTELPYGVGEAFSTAVRFVRVDRGCKVVDKDGEAAFVAFECVDDPSDKSGKIKRGSIEIIKMPSGIRAQVSLGDDTHGMELRWLELFERKLRDERGTPVAPPPAKEPAPTKEPVRDGGA